MKQSDQVAKRLNGEPLKIRVYADWHFLGKIQLMGFLTAQRLRGKEIFSFEYTETWINKQNEIANWRTVAKKYGISNSEIEQMKRAFRLV